MDEALFNGSYYQQNVTWRGLRASLSEEQMQAMRVKNPEEARLYESEGPKYQYGTGCISDGLFGVYLAKLCGMEVPLNHAHVVSNLRAIFKNNFKDVSVASRQPAAPGLLPGGRAGPTAVHLA